MIMRGLVQIVRENWRRWGLGYLLVVVLTLIMMLAFQYYEIRSKVPQRIQARVQQAFSLVEERSERIISGAIGTISKDNLTDKRTQFLTIVDFSLPSGYTILIWRGDSLVYWSDNRVPVVHSYLVDSHGNSGFLRLDNGYYFVRSQRISDYNIQLYFRFYQDFIFQNNYLKSGYNAIVNVPPDTKLDTVNNGFPIFSKSGAFMFSVVPSRCIHQSGTFRNALLIVYLIGLASFVLFFFRVLGFYSWIANSWYKRFGLLLGMLCLVRFIQQEMRFPELLYSGVLFSPELHSTSFFLPSLGDFVINSMLMFLVAILFYRHGLGNSSNRFQVHQPAWSSRVAVAIFILVILVYNYILLGFLIQNSSFSLDYRNIYRFSTESIWGSVVIIFLILSAVFIVQRILVFGFSVKDTVASGIVITFFFGIFVTVVLNSANSLKEREKRVLLALKLAERRNPLAEVLYEKIDRKIRSDSLIGQYIRLGSVDKYVREKYFHNFWDHYNIQLTVCSEGKQLKIQPQNYDINCEEYFSQLIKRLGEATQHSNLYFIDYGNGRENYLAVIYLWSGKSETRETLYIEFNSKSAFNDLGYPELLMDEQDLMAITSFAGYSYAIYKTGELVNAVGSYPYQIRLNLTNGTKTVRQFFTEGGMSHYYYVANHSVFIISTPSFDFFDSITPFSYLFIFSGLLLLLVHYIWYLSDGRGKESVMLKNKLQALIIGILVVSFLVVGLISVFNIVNINQVKNTIHLRERAISVLVEMQHKFGSYDVLPNREGGELDNMLVKFANVFYTDINLFSPDGRILGTSRPQIFSEGLVSQWINPVAFTKLTVYGQSSVIQKETIGGLQYSSAYLPFYNDQDVLLGYLNLPYFYREDALKEEVSTFLVTVVNIYVILILSGIIIIYFISHYITFPLAMLAEKLALLKVGKKNEKIEWEGRDEIGRLVGEYNRMVDELDKSAELLAKSEREGAWREMARQVAHEIRNPLTPMKLSVQHLQKAWDEQSPEIEQRLKTFSGTMIEQIDHLSEIATGFSDFARLNRVQKEIVSPGEIIRSVLNLYKVSSGIQFSLTDNAPGVKVFAGRSPLSRVFTNLLNNAVQAIAERPCGEIVICLEKENQHLVIEIKDNGNGISARQQEKIFQPDFTTKTSGTGLGLAIVKAIIEENGGDIAFTSEENKGTTFYLRFPVYER